MQMEDKVEDLIAAGVLDPAKVTRSGLINACGIAGIMLTTQARSSGRLPPPLVLHPVLQEDEMSRAAHSCSWLACEPSPEAALWMSVQAVMVEKPKKKTQAGGGGGGRANPMSEMGLGPSGMPAGLTM